MARKGKKGRRAAVGAMSGGRWRRMHRVLNWHDSHHLRWESQRDHIAEMGDDMMPTRRQRKAAEKASRDGVRTRGQALGEIRRKADEWRAMFEVQYPDLAFVIDDTGATVCAG